MTPDPLGRVAAQAGTVGEAARMILDSATWDDPPALFMVYRHEGKITFLASDLLQIASAQMRPAPAGIADVLNGIAWTAREWGVDAVAPPELCGVALFLAGWQVHFDPDNPAEHDQVQSWARDRRLSRHPDRQRIKAVHAAISGEPFLSVQHPKGGGAHIVEMTGGVPDALTAAAAAFVGNWRDGR